MMRRKEFYSEQKQLMWWTLGATVLRLRIDLGMKGSSETQLEKCNYNLWDCACGVVAATTATRADLRCGPPFLPNVYMWKG
jgi:hypothetical protein